MYAAVAFIEKKQINRNINLAGTRGRQVNNKEGGKSYELDDACIQSAGKCKEHTKVLETGQV